MKYQDQFSTRKTPQSEPIPGKDMVEDSAGGYAFAVDIWQRLDRFLILGSEGGTYYIKERKLTIENANAVVECIKEDGVRVVDRVVEISQAGRAPKNDPALFVLAMCAGMGDNKTRSYALTNLPKVARIGTHLFLFASYVSAFRGWGRALRNAIRHWYQDKSADRLAYQLVKYQKRHDWSHRDLLRLSHPVAQSKVQDALFAWAVGSEKEIKLHPLVGAFEKAKTADKTETVALIEKHGLTREMIKTEHLADPEVWEALFQKMPMTAMIRNLGNMTKVGFVKKGKFDVVGEISARLTDVATLKKARIHSLSILVAQRTYASGKGFRGGGGWEPVGDVIDALNEAFYLAFEAVEPTNKRYLLGIDVSGSMDWCKMGLPISEREAAASLAMVAYNTEPKSFTMAFSGEFVPINISRKDRLDRVCQAMKNIHMGRTNCALPMLYALKNSLEIDVFCVYTDNETWVGDIHPVQALQKYRQASGINAKLIVLGMTSNGFSIADPSDPRMLDVVGFDTSVPKVMSTFVSE